MEVYIAIFMFMVLFAPLAIFTLNRRWLLKLLLLATFFRVSIAVIHRYVFQLPQGTSDALAFNRTAVEWANQYGCAGFFDHFNPSASYVYSSVLAVFYSCIDQSVLGAHVINVVLSVYGIAFLALSCAKIWGEQEAKRVTLILAFFPFLAIYSSMLLREAFIFCFFSFAIYAATMFNEGRGRIHWLIASLLGFYLASIFHGAMILGAAGLLASIALKPAFKKSHSVRALAGKLLACMTLALIAVAVATYLISELSIQKIGSLSELELEDLNLAAGNRAVGNAAYLSGLSLSNPLDLIWQAPLRVVYLLFSPFPWHIRSPGHVLGLIDGIFYMMLVYLCIKHRRTILANHTLVTLLLIMGVLALAFAFGTSNFGTANRHRAKFFLVMLVVVAPWLTGSQVIFRNKFRRVRAVSSLR